jgi:putative transposase
VIDEAFGAVKTLAGTRAACAAVGRSRATHYRAFEPRKLGPSKPRPTPPNALCRTEQDVVLELLRGRFVDSTRPRPGPHCSTRAPTWPRSPRCTAC